MTRNLMAIAAAVAMLSGGYGRPIILAPDEFDDESRLKRAALEDACKRERKAIRDAADKRVKERIRRQVDAEARRREDFNKLCAGIDPTNDRPLSRQQRRALTRRNFPFLSDAASGILAEGGDAKQAPGDSLSSPAPKGDAQP